MWNDIPILTVLFRLKAIGILNSIEGIQGKCREVEIRIKELALNVRSK